MVPAIAKPTVTAGFRCAPLNCATANTPTITAMAQPKVITIQPLFCALDWLKRTAATTPSPSRISSAVPITSAPKILNCASSFVPTCAGRSRLRGCHPVRADAADSMSRCDDVAPGS